MTVEYPEIMKRIRKRASSTVGDQASDEQIKAAVSVYKYSPAMSCANTCKSH